MSIHKILCPTDFSTGSQFAARVAGRIAKRHGAEIVLAHVWDPGDYGLRGGAEDIVAKLRDHLAIEARSLAELTTTKVTSELATGVPWRELVALADRAHADLIVTGTHGRGAIARVLLGTVATRLVRHAPVPVLVAREREHVPAFRHVLVPVDFSEDSRVAVELASSYVELGGSITLVHVIEMPLTYGGSPTELGAQILERDAQRQLGAWADELRAKVGVTVATLMRFGPVAAEILDLLGAGEFDLAVTGSHGRTGLKRALLGSVAEKVVRHAPCAILVARTRG